MPAHALRSLSTGLAALGVALASGQIVVPASAIRANAGRRLAHSNYLIYKGKWNGVHANGTRAGVDGYHPADIQAAYGLSATGGSQAIAIVDPYHLPTSLNDFNVFAKQFGLAQETSTNATASTNKVFQVVYASGAKPANNGSWGGEIALDIEWAHATAPNAKIYLVECASENFDDLVVGIKKASALTDVRQVSMSFGASEDSSDLGLDSTFTTPNVVYFAAAGDASDLNYPAASPNVIGVGGTSPTLTSTSAVTSEVAWSLSGGGPSANEPLPAYQIGFTTGTRGTPDMAADADPQTGCAVYDSTPDPQDGVGVGWFVFGGTSLATPICAGVTNQRGNFSTSSYAELVRQYAFAGTSHFRDIVSGASTYPAHVGYDLVTGLGAPTNLFPTASLAPSAFAVTNGTPVGGVPGNVVAKDNHPYTLRSVATSGSQQTVTVQGTFADPLTAGASRISTSLSVTGTSGAATTLKLYNVSTGLYDVVSTLALSATNGTVSVALPDATNYFDSSGALRFIITGGSAGGAFRLGLDQIQLNVSTTN